jgi:multidrug efflux system membrane fusion protein
MRRSDSGKGRFFWTGVVAALTAVIAAAAVTLAAQGLIAEQQVQSDDAEPAVLITTVEMRKIADQVSGSVSVRPQYTWALARHVLPGSEPIFTRDGLSAGSSSELGTVVATLAERPVILLSGTVPAYRSLGVGDTGTDVAQLQDSLRLLGQKIADKAGVYGPSTATAVYQLYMTRTPAAQPVSREGTPVSKSTQQSTGVPLGEVRFLPSYPAKATTTCGTQGAMAGETLCDLTGGVPSLTVSVATKDSQSLVPGQPVTVTVSDGTTIDGTLGTKHDEAIPAVPATSSENGAGSSQGNPSSVATNGQATSPTVTEFAVDIPAEVVPQVGATGTALITVAATSDTALSIEAIAVRTDASGNPWVKSEDGERLPIALGLCANGFCEISGDRVSVGTNIVLPAAVSGSR